MFDQKCDSDIESDCVKMLWENCVPVQLCKFDYLKNNLTQLCQPQITFQKANNIVKNFIEQDKTNIKLLGQHLQQRAVTYQNLYANLYPKLCSRNTALEYTINLFLNIPMVIGIFKKQSINNEQEKIRLIAGAAAVKIVEQK